MKIVNLMMMERIMRMVVIKTVPIVSYQNCDTEISGPEDETEILKSPKIQVE